jgi:hypothetical protein
MACGSYPYYLRVGAGLKRRGGADERKRKRVHEKKARIGACGQELADLDTHIGEKSSGLVARIEE